MCAIFAIFFFSFPFSLFWHPGNVFITPDSNCGCCRRRRKLPPPPSSHKYSEQKRKEKGVCIISPARSGKRKDVCVRIVISSLIISQGICIRIHMCARLDLAFIFLNVREMTGCRGLYHTFGAIYRAHMRGFPVSPRIKIRIRESACGEKISIDEG